MIARPLEYHIGLSKLPHSENLETLWVLISAMCHVENVFPSSQRVQCKLRCGRKLYSTVVRCAKTKTLYST